MQRPLQAQQRRLLQAPHQVVCRVIIQATVCSKADHTPYIQAVFDNAPKHRQLPYTISDQKLKHIDPIIQGFSLLLTLPQRRMEIAYIFDLLDIPVIAKRFHLDEIKLKQLQNWVVDAGIRWGLESSVDEPHSWFIGIQRMLLGYVMESSGESWQGILPYDGATGLDAELIGLLSDFIKNLAKWHTILSQKYSIDKWQVLCTELLHEFFVFDINSEPLLLMIEEQWQLIVEQAQLANYQDKIGLTILRNLIQAKLEKNYLSHRFLAGKINFCTMMPMRSVPFKVVCLLGMNDGTYPRVSLPTSFDLISHDVRIGDRSRRQDDRYLFLEAVLSAQNKLYISYIGRDIQTNSVRYPSILVAELLDYLGQHYVLMGDESLSADLSSEKLQQSLIQTHTRMPFDSSNYANTNDININERDRRLISYADEWLPAAKRQGIHATFLHELNEFKVDVLMVDDLKRFYIHAIKELTKKRLGYLINGVNEQIPDAENFSLNALQLYHVNNQLIDELMTEPKVTALQFNKLYQRMLRGSQLPYGAFGHILYDEQKQTMQDLVERVNEVKLSDISSLDINCNINGVKLLGRVKNVQNDGILQWRSAKLTIRDGISLWIDHLIFCILHPDRCNSESRMYGRDNTVWSFFSLDQDKASLILSQLIESYQIGINQPFFMPLHSSWKWLETAYNRDTQNITDDPAILDKASANFISCWQGGFNSVSECDDYYFRLYPVLTESLINTAIASIQTHLLPIIQYRNK